MLEVVKLRIFEPFRSFFVVVFVNAMEIFDQHFVVVGFGIDKARFDLAGSGIFDIFEVERGNCSVVVADNDATRNAAVEKLFYAETEQGAVFEVECARRAAADFVADLGRSAFDFEAEFFQFFVEENVEYMRFRDVSEFRMSVFVKREFDPRTDDLLIRHEVENAFAYDYRAVVHAVDFSFYDRRDHHFYDPVECYFDVFEHFGDDYHRIVASRADSESKVSRFSAHRGDYEPVSARSCVFVDRRCDADAFVFSRLIAESGKSFGKRKVVVYRLRNVDVSDGKVFLVQVFRDPVRGGSGVVAANSNKKFDVVFDEEIGLELAVFRFVAAHFEEGTAAVEVVVGKIEIDVNGIDIVGEKCLRAVVDADDSVVRLQKNFRDRAYDRVYSRRRAAGAENCNRFFVHGFSSQNIE